MRPGNRAGTGRRLSRILAKPGFAVLVLAATAIAAPVVALVSVEQPDGGIGTGDIILITVVLLLVALFVVTLFNLVAGPDPEAEIIARNLATDPMSEQLLHRWLARSRWFRTIGGMCGVIVAVMAHAGQVLRLEVVLLFGTGGVLIGAAVSEWHRARRRRGSRIAAIEVRSVGQYLDETNRRRTLALGAINLVLLAVSTVDLNRAGVLWALLGLAVLGAARLFQHRVVSRPRPHLPKHLLEADDLARHLAISRNLAMPANIVAAAVLGNGFGNGLPPRSGNLDVVLGFGFLGVAVWWWWKNRRMGLTISTRRASTEPAADLAPATP